MDEYSRNSFRAIRDELAREQEKRRGSRLISVVIVLLFLAAGVFYVKTAQPQWWERAAGYVKSAAAGSKSLETLGNALFQRAGKQQPAENAAGESGNMLLTADNLSFRPSTDSQGGDALAVEQLAAQAVPVSVFPVHNASVTSVFGSRTDPVTGEADAGHHGVDLAASPGSDIFAYRDGTVEEAGKNAVYGNYVLLSHAGGIDSFYGHMKSVSVSAGDAVKAGDPIGVIGSTGKSTGVHLHFEIRVSGQRVDPMPYLYEKL